MAQCKNCNTPINSEHVFCCFCGVETEPVQGEHFLPETLKPPGSIGAVLKNSIPISDSGTMPDAIPPGTMPDAIPPGTMPDAIPPGTIPDAMPPTEEKWQQNDFTPSSSDEGVGESIPFPEQPEVNANNPFPSDVAASSVHIPEMSDSTPPERSVVAGDSAPPPFPEISEKPDAPADPNALPFPEVQEETVAAPFPPIPDKKPDALPFPDIPELQQGGANDAPISGSGVDNSPGSNMAQQNVQMVPLPNVENKPAIDVQKLELPPAQSLPTPAVVQQKNTVATTQADTAAVPTQEREGEDEGHISRVNLEALLEPENGPECCDMCGEEKAVGAIYCTACGCRI